MNFDRGDIGVSIQAVVLGLLYFYIISNRFSWARAFGVPLVAHAIACGLAIIIGGRTVASSVLYFGIFLTVSGTQAMILRNAPRPSLEQRSSSALKPPDDHNCD